MATDAGTDALDSIGLHTSGHGLTRDHLKAVVARVLARLTVQGGKRSPAALRGRSLHCRKRMQTREQCSHMASNWRIPWCDLDVFMSSDADETVYATSLAARRD